jgi:hypothetical protein
MDAPSNDAAKLVATTGVPAIVVGNAEAPTATSLNTTMGGGNVTEAGLS